MFEDQTIDLLPARTTLQTGGAGGRGGRGGDALAISAAVIAVGGRDRGDLTATSADATAIGGTGVQGAGDHRGGQRRLGREPGLRPDALLPIDRGQARPPRRPFDDLTQPTSGNMWIPAITRTVTVSLSASSSARPPDCARASTGARPPTDTRFGSSNVADNAGEP